MHCRHVVLVQQHSLYCIACSKGIKYNLYIVIYALSEHMDNNTYYVSISRPWHTVITSLWTSHSIKKPSKLCCFFKLDISKLCRLSHMSTRLRYKTGTCFCLFQSPMDYRSRFQPSVYGIPVEDPQWDQTPSAFYIILALFI
jgi:hypothetical protein